jgi:hypothetical protein
MIHAVQLIRCGQVVSYEFLTQLDLARRWRMSPRTLERWRWLRKGPAYVRIAHVLYRLEDVKAYEAAHLSITGKHGKI